MCIFQSFSYSLDMAKALGINNSVFIALLYMQSNLQNIEVSSGKLFLTRQSIYNLTGMDEDKQGEVENSLTSCGILDVKNRKDSPNFYYTLNEAKLSLALKHVDVLVKPEMLDMHTSVVEKSNKPKGKTKAEKHVEQLKRSLKCDDEVIKQRLCDWIDSVHERGSFIPTNGLQLYINDLFAYSNDQQTLLNILDIAIKNGWRDLKLTAEKYGQNCSTSGRNFASYLDIKSTGESEVSETF